MKPTITLRDVSVAIASAVVVTILFSIRIGYASGNWRHGVMIAFFAIPFALSVTVIVEIPVLVLMKRLRCTHPMYYVLIPAITVLLVYMAPFFLNDGKINVSRAYGRSLIDDGQIVWKNIGWAAIDHIEPALWAAIAGLLFWWLAVRGRWLFSSVMR